MPQKVWRSPRALRMRGGDAADGGAAGGQLNTPPGWGGCLPISHPDRMTRTVISPAAAFGGGKRPITFELVSEQMPGHFMCPEGAGPMAGVGPASQSLRTLVIGVGGGQQTG